MMIISSLIPGAYRARVHATIGTQGLTGAAHLHYAQHRRKVSDDATILEDESWSLPPSLPVRYVGVTFFKLRLYLGDAHFRFPKTHSKPWFLQTRPSS
jgi:hypothetical protein